jgi:NAD+ synthetase
VKIKIAQINPKVGDLAGNVFRITDAISKGNADIVVFPEMSLVGYPAQDLQLNLGFLKAVKTQINTLVKFSKDIEAAFVIGAPLRSGKKIYNCAMVIHKGKILKTIRKIALPNYGVFDEKRIFSSASSPVVFEFQNKKICILICEDLWEDKVVKKVQSQKPDVVISINASPFDIQKSTKRKELVKIGIPVVYVNQVGGQDDLVFDGGSFVTNQNGDVIWQAKYFEEDFVNFEFGASKEIINANEVLEEKVYNALVLGLRDYLHKTGFSKVLLGLSGGIDSALVAAIACDALGSENVRGVRMPSQYSSEHSLDDAKDSADRLGCKLETIAIKNLFETFGVALEESFKNTKSDLTEENLQARIRGVLLMAISNKKGELLLATGNKSEYACGYSTLYGDMCGAFAPLKDVYKTMVYKLSNWRNKNIPTISLLQKLDVIPQSSITKPPSAELKPNQTDQDTLPPYDILDKILYHLIEEDLSVKEIIKKGFDKKLVARTYKMLIAAEYKRNQAPIGTKISIRDLTKDRRYPIVNSLSY